MKNTFGMNVSKEIGDYEKQTIQKHYHKKSLRFTRE
jgi:hypothetical protein